MRRRKNKVYLHVTHSSRNASSDQLTFPHVSPSPAFGATDENRRKSAKHAKLPEICMISQRFSPWKKRRKAEKIRELLQKVTGLSAFLGWCISVLGCLEVRKVNEAEEVNSEERNAVLGCMWMLSILQVGLIVIYSRHLQVYLQVLRVTLRLSDLKVPSLRKSTRLMLLCALECGFNVCIAPPLVRFQGKIYMKPAYSELSLDDFLLPLVLLRNYHTFRCLFWCSQFSRPRSYLYSVLVGSEYTGGFELKCILKSFSLRIVLFLYGTLVVISGLSLYAMEKGTPHSHFSTVDSGMWTTVISSLTIGYGDLIPTTYIGFPILLLILFLGLLLNSLVLSLASSYMQLNQRESGMYSSLAVMRYRQKKTKETVILIQAWWRFMRMRQKRKLHGFVIVHFYTLMRTYRKINAAAEREKDKKLEMQIEAVEKRLHRNFRGINEYLHPIRDTKELVIDIVRREYDIQERIHHLRRQVTRLQSEKCASPPIIPRENSEISSRNSPDIRGSGRAKARARAAQKVKARLLREKDLEIVTLVGLM